MEIGDWACRSGNLQSPISNLHFSVDSSAIWVRSRRLGFGVALLGRPGATGARTRRSWRKRAPSRPARRGRCWCGLRNTWRSSATRARGWPTRSATPLAGSTARSCWGRYLAESIGDHFPVALLIKLSLSLLGLGLLLALLRRQTLRNWALAAAGALLVASLGFRLQMGVRLVLPLVGLATVGLAAAAVNVCRDPGERRLEAAPHRGGPAGRARSGPPARRREFRPHGLCSTPTSSGAARRTATGWSATSNYDWGQGLNELARWSGGIATAPGRLVLRHRPDDTAAAAAAGALPCPYRGGYAGRGSSAGRPALRGGGDHLPLWSGVHGRPRPGGAVLPLAVAADRTTTFLIYDLTRPRAPTPAPSGG